MCLCWGGGSNGQGAMQALGCGRASPTTAIAWSAPCRLHTRAMPPDREGDSLTLSVSLSLFVAGGGGGMH